MGEIPREGELSRQPVPRLLLGLLRERFDGALRLTLGRTEKRILLRHGVPVFAESNLPSESLGVQLLDDGLISREQHARVSLEVQEKGLKEGSALLALGALSPKEIFQALKDQVRRRILACFAWSEGRWLLEPGDAPPDDAQAFRSDPVALVLEGLLRHWGPNRLLADLTPRLDLAADPAGDFAPLRARLTGEPDASALLDALAAGSTLGAALERGASPSALAAAWIADAAGAVAWRAPGRPPRESDDDAGPEVELVFGDEADESGDAGAAPRAARGGSARDDQGLAALRREVLERHGRLGELDYYGVLGVGRDAPPAAVKTAYLKAAKRFHPDALAGMGLGDVRDQATALFARVARAYATLSDPEARRNYDAELDGHATVDADRIANAEALYRKGEILLRAGDFAGALPFLKPAVELWPEEPAYRSALGWALFKRTPPEPKAAREQLEQAVALDARDARAHYRLGLVLRELGETAAGEREIAVARKLDPKVSGR